MTIPKIIHYCWFGPKPLPELEKKCIDSWKKYFPNYKLMFWNENTFKVNSYKFSKEAYEKKYYAFVSDFVRTIVLRKYGGIYLDTDVEILSDFSSFLNDKEAVLGFENKTNVGTALMAFTPNHPIMIEFANYYENGSFISHKGNMEITANISILAKILKKHKILLNGEEQMVNGVKLYPRNIFYPKKIADKKFNITKESMTVHHFQGSWLSPRQKRRGQNKFWIEVCRPLLRKSKNVLTIILGDKQARKIENSIRNWLR